MKRTTSGVTMKRTTTGVRRRHAAIGLARRCASIGVDIRRASTGVNRRRPKIRVGTRRATMGVGRRHCTPPRLRYTTNPIVGCISRPWKSSNSFVRQTRFGQNMLPFSIGSQRTIWDRKCKSSCSMFINNFFKGEVYSSSSRQAQKKLVHPCRGVRPI